MKEYIEVHAELKPRNGRDFAIGDVNDLRGGYIQVDTEAQMEAFKSTNKLKEGMLCYVKETSAEDHMFQFIKGAWTVWKVSGGGSGGGMSIIIVGSLADLDNEELKVKGQIVFVESLNEIRYYNGYVWESFSKVYIQNKPPEDEGGLWIDDSDTQGHLDNTNVIDELLQFIKLLQDKVNVLEFAVLNTHDYGDFSNNQFFAYDNFPDPEEPNYGTSEEEDDEQQAINKDFPLADSPEPTTYKDLLPNGKHLKVKSGTKAMMEANKDNFMPCELLLCYDVNELWYKHPISNKLMKLIGGGSPDPEPGEDVEGILTEVIGSGSAAKERIVGIEFADMAAKDNIYRVQVKDGKLDIVDYRLQINNLAGNAQVPSQGVFYTKPYFPIIPAEVGSTDSPKIYVNSVYCGADSDKYSYNPVSHNFVELVNLGKKDLNLKGLYLHYTEGGSGDWISLPLIGVIKSNGTFLIRGAQCSVEQINTTYIKVGEPDMYWTKDSTYNNDRLEVAEGEGAEAHSVWNGDNMIKFAYNCAFYISGEETTDYYKDNVLSNRAPWNSVGVVKWYVDLVGIGKYNDRAMPCEASSISNLGSNTLLMRYYDMDPVKQATKATSARSNVKDWTYINMADINPKIDIEDYTPKASFQNKTIFFNKHLLQEGKPNVITCTFGHNAHTTRCFTWMSVGYYDEYIRIRKKGTTEWSVFESFKAADLNSDGQSTNANRPNTKNWNHRIYNRIRSITTDGTPFTVHKFMKDFTEPSADEVWEYSCGREGNWSEVREFTLRNRASVISNGFNFLQVTDQQGFNAEEYETWRLAAEFIDKDKVTNPYHFSINTGDATQNGNRINEWLDYFNAGDVIFSKTEQMYTVGNNDLCPLDVYVLGDGEDISKTNPINVEYFFTFEHPYQVPISSAGVYVPCVYSFVYGDTYYLCMNSEITELARTDIFKDITGENVYNELKNWAVSDLAQHTSDSNIRWRVSFCHEAPFTIITADLIMSYLKKNASGGYDKDTQVKRGGSHLNTVGNYWFSQFLQQNNFKLCMCGHKHTYANSRPIHDDVSKTMEPIVFDKFDSPDWYNALPAREKQCVQLSKDAGMGFVKYVMCQATGYKLTSNKELPAQNIPWLLEYYPVSSQVENDTTNTATVKVNKAQQYPNYIIWNVGTGAETEVSNTAGTSRNRIKGLSYKLQLIATTDVWAYKYNVPITIADLKKVGGNGANNPNNNILVEETWT